MLTRINNRDNQEDWSRNILDVDNYFVKQKEEKEEEKDEGNQSDGNIPEIDETTPQKVQNEGNSWKELNKDETQHSPYFYSPEMHIRSNIYVSRTLKNLTSCPQYHPMHPILILATPRSVLCCSHRWELPGINHIFVMTMVFYPYN